MLAALAAFAALPRAPRDRGWELPVSAARAVAPPNLREVRAETLHEPTLDLTIHELWLSGREGATMLLDGELDASVTLSALDAEGKALQIATRRLEPGLYERVHAVLSFASTGLDGAKIPVYCNGETTALTSAWMCVLEWPLEQELSIDDPGAMLWLRIDAPRDVGPDGKSIVVLPRLALAATEAGVAAPVPLDGALDGARR
ncbi:MAG: hypothetical protein EPO68_08920 [Planctomycetota bacterium]|nr:MAG: hypothetical protein EPO68_08920 [Planctomycetota bacterium]